MTMKNRDDLPLLDSGLNDSHEGSFVRRVTRTFGWRLRRHQTAIRLPEVKVAS